MWYKAEDTYIFGIDGLNQLGVDRTDHEHNDHEKLQRHQVLEHGLPRGSMHLNVRNNQLLKTNYLN